MVVRATASRVFGDENNAQTLTCESSQETRDELILESMNRLESERIMNVEVRSLDAKLRLSIEINIAKSRDFGMESPHRFGWTA